MRALDIDTIFSKQSIDSEAQCVDRVNFVLCVYSKWIQFTKSEYEQNEHGDGAMTMKIRRSIDVVDLMDNELPGNYQFSDLQTDFNRILKNNDLLKQRNDTDTVFDAESSRRTVIFCGVTNDQKPFIRGMNTKWTLCSLSTTTTTTIRGRRW